MGGGMGGGMGGMGGGMAMPPPGGGGLLGGAAPSQEEIMGFIAANPSLDERAIQALSEATPEVQRVVIDRGNLAETHPSTCLIGRLRDACMAVLRGGGNPGSAGSRTGGGGGG